MRRPAGWAGRLGLAALLGAAGCGDGTLSASGDDAGPVGPAGPAGPGDAAGGAQPASDAAETDSHPPGTGDVGLHPLTDAAPDPQTDAAPGPTADAAPVPIADAAAPPPPGPVCDPPNTVQVGDRCVPSCGGAGGNTCVGADSTLCDGWPALESYDCARCCNVPPAPALRANSYHTVIIADTDRWNAIRALSDADLGPMITSQNHPADLPFERWARNITAFNGDVPRDPVELAQAVHRSFLGQDEQGGAPAKILIDELSSGSAAMLEAFAHHMEATYPQWRGRWGFHLAPGENVDYGAWQAPIDAALSAGAILSPEMYFYRSRYCVNGGNGGERDIWLAGQFEGTGGLRRVGFLLDERARLGSTSAISPAFGVIDLRCRVENGARICDQEGYLSGPSPALFLDRMFYVWVTRTRPDMVDLVRPENGGIGAWKWDAEQVTSSSRDERFAEAFQHYLVQGDHHSLLGPVDCP